MNLLNKSFFLNILINNFEWLIEPFNLINTSHQNFKTVAGVNY